MVGTSQSSPMNTRTRYTGVLAEDADDPRRQPLLGLDVCSSLASGSATAVDT